MKWLVPSPALSLTSLVLWVLLTQSWTAGSILLGTGLALFWPFVAARIGAGALHPKRPLLVLRLALRVLADMLWSNGQVGWAILTRRSRALRSVFVQIPLELSDPAGLSVLAMIVTLTPGTAWAELSADRRYLTLHAFDVDEDQKLVNLIKTRYESRLKRIFE